MAQDFVGKRRTLAAQMVTDTEKLVALTNSLMNNRGAVMGAGGEFKDEDFAQPAIINGVNIAHLQAYEPNVMKDTIIPDLIQWLEGPVQGTSGTTRRQIINAIVGKVT